MNREDTSSIKHGLTILAIIMILWGVMSTTVGIFVNPLYLVAGLIQISTSVQAIVFACKSGFGNIAARVYTVVYLGVVSCICLVGAYISSNDEIVASVFFASIAALAISCLASFCKQWKNGKF